MSSPSAWVRTKPIVCTAKRFDRLTQAIAKRRTVQMRYYSASRLRTTRREVDPYRLWYASGGLYLVGYCHWRKEPRMFAVERMKAA